MPFDSHTAVGALQRASAHFAQVRNTATGSDKELAIGLMALSEGLQVMSRMLKAMYDHEIAQPAKHKADMLNMVNLMQQTSPMQQITQQLQTLMSSINGNNRPR